MIINDPIADVIARINLGIQFGRSSVISRKSKYIINFLQVLVEEGFLVNYTVEADSINIYLKYLNGVSVIRKLVKVSTISRKVTLTIRQLPSFRKYRFIEGTYIISTHKGLITYRDALRLHISGEIICLVY